MKRGTAFTPDGPLTLGDLREIVRDHYGDNIAGGPDSYLGDSRLVEIRTPVAGERRQVTLTVTNQRWQPPAEEASDAEPGDGNQAAD